MPPYQEAANVAVLFSLEANFGTAAANTSSTQLRLNASGGMALTKALARSNELRQDGMMILPRHAARSVAGSYPVDLSIQSHDILIEAVMRGTLSSLAVFGTTGTISSTAGSKTFTFGSGNPIALGARVGDVINWSGWTGSGTLMNGVNQRITGLSSTSITVAEAVQTMTASQVAVAQRVGHTVLNGTARRSFTFEEQNLDTLVSELYVGDRITSLALSMSPNNEISATFGVTGKDLAALGTGTSYPYFTASTGFQTVGLVAVDAVLRYGTLDVADLTSLSVTITPGGSGAQVIGGTTTPDVFQGLTSVTGKISGLRSDLAKLNDFAAENTLSLHLLMVQPGTAPQQFHSLFIPQVKINSNSKQYQQSGPLIESLDFEAGKDTRGTANGFDATVCKYQVSN